MSEGSSGSSGASDPSAVPAAGSGNAAQTTLPCQKKLLAVVWSPAEAMCGDNTQLNATANNFDANTSGSANITNKTKSDAAVATVDAKGQDTFSFPWQVKDIVFDTSTPPQQYEMMGKVSAGGQMVQTQDMLKVKRIPDKAPEACSTHVTSTAIPGGTGNYNWDVKFRLESANGDLTTHIQMQFVKTWKAYRVDFDPHPTPAGDGKSGWAWIKKDGADWKYWNTAATPPAWTALPRPIASYTQTARYFVQSGTTYADRDGGSDIWPEAFPDSPDFASKKPLWLQNIRATWSDTFKLHRKGCPSTKANCCTWIIHVHPSFDDSSGDVVVHAVWTQDYRNERSDSSAWYLSDARDGLGPHEFGHLLGAYDEYTNGALDPTGGAGGTAGPIDPNTIMGQNLPLTAKPRHLNNWLALVKAKVNSWISRTWDFEVLNV